MKRFFKKLSDRGSTFVIVITTIGFVGVVTSLVLMVTSSGYQTKAIDNQAKNNFYSAEEIVDQIKTGLHNDMSKAIMNAYFDTLTTYYDDNFATESDSNIRKQKLKEVNDNFKTNALGSKTTRTGFIGMIHDSTQSDDVVSKIVLNSYISSNYRAEIGRDIFKIGVKKNEASPDNITFKVDIKDIYAPDGSFEKKEYSITIQNIGINYVNELGYTNNVFTDIKMTIPDIDLSYIDLDRNLDFVRYGLLAKNNVSITGGNGVYASAIVGNFWIGDNLNITGGARLKTLSDYGYIGGDMNLNVNASTKAAAGKPVNGYTRDSMFEMNILTGENGYYSGQLQHRYRSPGGETVKGFSVYQQLASLETKSGSQLYERNSSNVIKQMNKTGGTKTNKYSMVDTYLAVEDILMNDASATGTNTRNINTINTDANLLVKNDMLFNVDYAHADIRNMYHGYGYSNATINTNADDNSSIILNNKNCNLEMTLRGLSILGSAFIKTDDSSSNSNYSFPYAASDILTGDSLIVRGNQIAYLVPAKYVPGFQTNPVTSAEAGATDLNAYATTIMEYIENEDRALVDRYFAQNRSSFVKPILYSYTGAGRSNYVVYYYFSFANAALAADYYMDGVDKNGVKLVSDVTKKTLLGLIPADINVEVEELPVSTIVGNYISELKSTDAGVDGTYAMQKGAVSNTTPGKVYSDIVTNMKSFLRKSIPKSIEDEAINPATGKNEILETFMSRDAVDNIVDWTLINRSMTLDKRYALNGKNVKVIVTSGDYNINNGGTPETYLLIAKGNVKIESNSYVQGLIISRGNITIGNGVTIDAYPEHIEDVFRNAAMYKTSEGVLLSKIFRGYDYERRIGEDIDIRDYMIDLNSMFTYQNWSRQ